jgi:hypothetical protein
MDIWDDGIKIYETEKKLDELMDEYIFFFKRGDEIFGAPEESRLVYARMKNPDDDGTWADDADFSGFELKSAMKGEKVQKLFNKKDLDEIKVLDSDKVREMLK